MFVSKDPNKSIQAVSFGEWLNDSYKAGKIRTYVYRVKVGDKYVTKSAGLKKTRKRKKRKR